jgi:ADP-ribosyl-[dinitrogen reductase] hydrolase
VHKCSGWVRVALSYAVHFLVCGTTYRESIKWIVSQKGDPDTNACIMGGLLGAYYGTIALEMDKEI